MPCGVEGAATATRAEGDASCSAWLSAGARLRHCVHWIETGGRTCAHVRNLDCLKACVGCVHCVGLFGIGDLFHF